MAQFYRIGTPGIPWGAVEKAAWAKEVGVVRRTYADGVLAKLEPLKSRFDVVQYGQLDQDARRYPLFCIRTKGFGMSAESPASPRRKKTRILGCPTSPHQKRPRILVTGGVHGYETSGVQGALLFADKHMERYSELGFDICVCPCVSPWGYECVQRWAENSVDVNRSFFDTPAECTTEEAASVVALVRELGGRNPVVGSSADGHDGGSNCGWALHMDLHETTDSDATEFRPARAARDGQAEFVDTKGIPDGFYLVGDSVVESSSQLVVTAWHKAVIDSVRRVTPIAPAEVDAATAGDCGDAATGRGRLLGEPLTQEGVIVVPARELHICASVTGAKFVGVTEVYPDSKNPFVTPENCNEAQVAAVTVAIDFVAKELGLDSAIA
eukprot:CAMPEP_0198570316 /NCGR_PEP_ID=MMETSP1462-20131121/108933_1 /TAXON_ID=1333877 /ORGANISM="Brandtodinium nutriculum, Strain RCC3387" /LENGTH=382 /DNA_ID=CAMNT_0044301431 /DNA_START=6 /DNA_END=1154 /DNA_ORIENTATION=-